MHQRAVQRNIGAFTFVTKRSHVIMRIGQLRPSANSGQNHVRRIITTSNSIELSIIHLLRLYLWRPVNCVRMYARLTPTDHYQCAYDEKPILGTTRNTLKCRHMPWPWARRRDAAYWYLKVLFVLIFVGTPPYFRIDNGELHATIRHDKLCSPLAIASPFAIMSARMP